MTGNASKFFASAALILAVVAPWPARAAGAEKALAVVNGQSITEADVRAAKADEFATMEREYQQSVHQLIENSLDELINDKLVQAEAAARGVTKEAVLAEIHPGPVTDADVDKFYEENKAQIPKPKDEIAGNIRQYLEQQGQQAARAAFYDGLKSRYKIDMKLEPIRVEVSASGPAVGPANAPVTIVEFSDFQCPYCGRLFPTLEAVKAKYGDKVRLVFRQYPLPFHPFAAKAAEAALCADEQGKFWELHDVMFKNQQALAVDDLKKAAAALGLNAAAFASCLDSGKTVATVERDKKDGSAAGVSGTPAMFINGRFVSGAVPIEDISKVIDDELRRSGK